MSAVVEHVACTFCGCVCDDIVVECEGSEIIKARRACAVGRGVLTGRDSVVRRPTVRGREVEWQEAVGEAASILEQADSPLIYLSLIHISEPTRRTPISYAVFCLKKKKIN